MDQSAQKHDKSFTVHASLKSHKSQITKVIIAEIILTLKRNPLLLLAGVFAFNPK